MTSSALRVRRKGRAGFTLTEVLAAMLIMALVLPVVMQGAVLASRVGTIADRARKAARLADSKLTEVVVSESWRDGDETGNFGPTEPDYTWRVSSEGWSEDTMRVVSVEVRYLVQGREYVTRLSTLAPEESSDDSSSTSESTTGEAS